MTGEQLRRLILFRNESNDSQGIVMINLFDRPRRYLNIAIIFVAALLVLLVFLAILFWRVPWFVPSWLLAQSPQQVGMLRWNQQGFPVSLSVGTSDPSTPVLYSDVAFDGKKLWVTYTEGNQGFVVSYDPLTGTSGVPIKVGNDPGGVLFDGQHVWVANRGSQGLSCFEPYGNVVAPAETPGPTAAPSELDVTATPAAIVTYTWKLEGSSTRSSTPSDLAYDGDHILVTDRDGGAVWRLPASSCEKPATGEHADIRIGEVNGESFERPLGIIFDGEYIWVADHGSNKVIRLNPDDCDVDTCEEARIIKVGDANSHPSNLAYDGTFVWVTLKGANSGQVARIHAQTGLVFGEPVLRQPITISTLRGAGAKPGDTPPCSNVKEELDGIAFDGKYIWIASNTGWVCQVRATDAAPVAEFRAIGTEQFASGNDNAASRIAFEGTFVWTIITNGAKSSFTRR